MEKGLHRKAEDIAYCEKSRAIGKLEPHMEQSE